MSQYLANGTMGINKHVDAVKAAQAAEDAGAVPPGTARMIASSSAPVLDHLQSVIRAIQAHHTGAQLDALGIPAGSQQSAVSEASTNQGWAVEHSQQARTNAAGYQQGALALASVLQDQGLHDAALAALDIAVGKKTVADKRAARAALPPEVAQHIPDWLVDHGMK